MCPPEFPAGFYWYGARRCGPGRPPKWINQMMNSQGTTDHNVSTEGADHDSDENDDTDTDAAREGEDSREELDSITVPTRSRTRVVTLPDCYM